MRVVFDRVSDVILWVCDKVEPLAPGEPEHWFFTFWHGRVCHPFDRWYITTFYPEQADRYDHA